MKHAIWWLVDISSISGTLAEEDLKMDSLVDEINAYTYLYPVELPSSKFLFKWCMNSVQISEFSFGVYFKCHSKLKYDVDYG